MMFRQQMLQCKKWIYIFWVESDGKWVELGGASANVCIFGIFWEAKCGVLFSDNRPKQTQTPQQKVSNVLIALIVSDNLCQLITPKSTKKVRLHLPGKRCVLAFSWTLISWEASVSECSPSSTHQYQMIHLASYYKDVFRQHFGVIPDTVRGISNCCSKLQKEEEVAFPRVNVQHSRVLR